MEYIVHRRFTGKAASGESVNLATGTTYQTIGNWIADGNKAICSTHSENAHKYFARNDDSQGLKRGELTYKIAYAPRNSGDGFRFSDEQRNLLATKWARFLRPEHDFIIFNDDFFNAEILELMQLNYELGG